MQKPIYNFKTVKRDNGWFGLLFKLCGLIFIATIISAFIWGKTVEKTEKLYPMNQTITEWDRDIMGFDYVKNRVSMSDLSAKDIKYINDSIIGVFQIKMKNQILPLYQMEQKRLQDSINASKVKPKQ